VPVRGPTRFLVCLTMTGSLSRKEGLMTQTSTATQIIWNATCGATICILLDENAALRCLDTDSDDNIRMNLNFVF